MRKRQTIMHRDTEDDAQVVFLDDIDLMALRQVYYMPQEQYQAMGRPDTITLTVEKGDTLNDEIDPVTHRSSITGKFVDEEYAQANPDITVTERE